MEFQLSEEEAKELNLEQEQIDKLSEIGRNRIADIQKSLDEKYKLEANTNAEKILEGAAKLVQEKTGIERNKGEKLGEYFERTGSSFFDEKQKELDKAKADYEEKIKNVGDGAKLKEELDNYKKQVAKIDEEYIKKDEYETLKTEYSSLKQSTAFSKALPQIPDSINQYEKKARLDEARKEILSKFDIKFDEEGEPWAVNKENEFDKQKLSDVLKSNESIKAMIESAEGGEDPKKPGFGGKGKGKPVQIDGVPFEVTKEMSSADRSKAIREHLVGKGLAVTDPKYAQQFKELHEKITKGLQQ